MAADRTQGKEKPPSKETSIPPELSKTKRHRLFNVSDNLHDWLEFCRARGTPLIPINLKNKRQAFVKTLSFPWIQDGLRHRFGTFHYAKHHNTEELRHIMGNSPSVIDRFYKGAISNVEVEKFWGILPGSVATVTSWRRSLVASVG